jgi:hypothetical protein
MHETDEFWDELLAQIDAQRVIPVVGPELLTVIVEGRESGLYPTLAQRLLARYGVDTHVAGTVSNTAPASNAITLRPYHELNDAVCALVQRGKRVQDLYRPVSDLLKALLEAQTAPLQPLRQLARIRGFKLFVSVTADDLLARALDAERHGGQSKTEHIVFAPKLANPTDLPGAPSSGYTGVCYMFGKASPTPFVFAIHDEDTLEFVHKLQIDNSDGKKRWLAELRSQNLLLIGCNFDDWLSRFFIRLSNTQRLADVRGKREFLIEQGPQSGGSLTLFLEKFSPETWVYPGSAHAFVAELARRWEDKHPPSAQGAGSVSSSVVVPTRSPSSETFFISYSRTDLAAATQLFQDLQGIGADIAWFDKSALQPGDDWESKIRSAIESCWLFLPLISATTERREEGNFREEWLQAVERERRIQGRKFIVPIVVDTDYGGDPDRYRRVPDRFRAAQFGHAPDGRFSEPLRNELTRLIRERRSQGLS